MNTTLISNLPERYIQNDLRPTLVGLSRDELAEMMARIGVAEKQRKMRARQLWHWIYNKGITSFDLMTDISKDLRVKLEEAFRVDRPEIVTEQKSSDGTMKWRGDYPGMWVDPAELTSAVQAQLR